MTRTARQQPLSYQPDLSRYDEAFKQNAEVLPHWSYLLDSLRTLGREELARRQQTAQRILRDDGASHATLEAPGKSKTWALDAVPLLIESSHWSNVESGLIERAELLDLVLKDLYNERELIRHNILPPELLFGHKGFLRACQGIQLDNPRQLIFHSADMIHTSSGEVCILTDRTQIPRGIGYTLENRTVMSRVFPSLFRDSQVHRLALFYQTLRHSLNQLAPDSSDARPQVVVMTPGAYSPSYFEHIALANYLGYPLVQGGDLTVRSGRVWMKSVGGLTPVDVILRFVNDSYCDPVELRSDSHLGVPGLLEAARSGRVTVVNPLGASVLENPVLLKYMPAISEFFLGRPLRLRSVGTYWCGDPDDMAYVEARFDQLVIKHINASREHHSIFVRELTQTEKAEWLQRIRTTPHSFVAQEYIEPSRSPAFIDGELRPRPILFRSFAVATEGSYSVLPGGLARITPDSRNLHSADDNGTLSKDTWVLASEPEKQLSLTKTRSSQVGWQHEEGSRLPSRVVENLFWMGRYAERAETTARLVRTVLMQISSSLQLPKDARQLMLSAITEVTDTAPGFRGPEAARLFEAPDSELQSVLLDGQRPGSLSHSMLAMLNCGEEVKEQLSADAQRIVNDMRDELQVLEQALKRGMTSAPEETLDPLVTALLALAGQAQESMFRSTGWHFLEMGRRLEKAYQCAGLLRALLVACQSGRSADIALETLLLSAEALISYRRRYRAQPDIDNVLHLMLLDKSNPRSLLFLLRSLQEHLDAVCADHRSTTMTPAQKRLLAASTELQLCDLEQLLQADENGLERPALEQFLKQLQDSLYTVASHISDLYFDHTGGPQQLGQGEWENEP